MQHRNGKPVVNIVINDEREKEALVNSLKGNIVRLCLSRDYKEIDTMLDFAHARIDALARYTLSKIEKE